VIPLVRGPEPIGLDTRRATKLAAARRAFDHAEPPVLDDSRSTPSAATLTRCSGSP
jgi:hypothetical protein